MAMHGGTTLNRAEYRRLLALIADRDAKIDRLRAEVEEHRQAMNIAAMDAERNEICERCGCGYACWSAPSDLWNLAMRGGDRAAAEDMGFVCPRCFMVLVEERVPGASKLWIVRPEQDGDFEAFKPSGRFPRSPEEQKDGVWLTGEEAAMIREHVHTGGDCDYGCVALLTPDSERSE